MSATSAVIGRCLWSIRVQINGCRQGKLVFFVLFNMARGFENVCEIISDQSKWKPRKKLSRSYLQRRKMENQRQKELLTTWECLNYKKSSQQLPSCVIATRDSLFCKMPLPLFCFEQEKTLKNFSKKLYTNTIKKREEAETKNSVWNLKSALTSTILEQSGGTRQIRVSVYFLFWSLHKTNTTQSGV